VLPAIAIGAWKMRKLPRQIRLLFVLVAMLAATEAWRWLCGAPVATEGNDRTPVADSLQGFVANFGSLALHDPVNTVLIVAGFAASLWTWRNGNHGDTSSRRRWLAGFALISAILPIVVTLALGRFHTVEELRYLQSLQLLGLPLAGLLAEGIERIARTRAPVLIACALVLAIIAAPTWSGASRAALRDYLVDQETCLRDAIAREHLALGAATYWRANELTARFPNGPLIVPLSVDVAPRMRNNVDLGWLSPIDANAPLPPLTFVDEYGYASDALDRSFGPASRRVVCPRSAYRLYEPEDGALAHLYGYADWLPSQLLQRTRVATVPAAAWAAEPKYAAGDAVRAAGTFAQPTLVLATAIDIPKGVVAVDLAYRFRVLGPGAMVQWHIAIVDEAGKPQTDLGSGRLDASAGERRLALPLGARGAAGDVLGISLAVAGDVDLEVSRVRVAVR